MNYIVQESIPGMELYEIQKDYYFQASPKLLGFVNRTNEVVSNIQFFWETQIPQFLIIAAAFFYLYLAYVGTYNGLETVHNLFKLVCYNYRPSRYSIKQKRLRHRFLKTYCSFKKIHSEEIENKKFENSKEPYNFNIHISHRFFKSFEFITAESLIGLCDLYIQTSESYVKNLAKIRIQNMISNYLNIYKDCGNKNQAVISLKLKILQNLCSTYTNVYEIMKIIETLINISFNEIAIKLNDEFNIFVIDKLFWHDRLKINYEGLRRFNQYYISKEI